MTDTTIIIVNILTALPPTLFALGALRRGNRNGEAIQDATSLLGHQQRLTSEKADTLIQKTDEIHVLTNSNLTALKADLALALQRITQLEEALVHQHATVPAPAPLPGSAPR